MLNTPTDGKIRNNPIIVSPYFNDYQLKINAAPPPEGDNIIDENGDFITDESGNQLITE